MKQRRGRLAFSSAACSQPWKPRRLQIRTSRCPVSPGKWARV